MKKIRSEESGAPREVPHFLRVVRALARVSGAALPIAAIVSTVAPGCHDGTIFGMPSPTDYDVDGGDGGGLGGGGGGVGNHDGGPVGKVAMTDGGEDGAGGAGGQGGDGGAGGMER